jgi:hypothetical protein
MANKIAEKEFETIVFTEKSENFEDMNCKMELDHVQECYYVVGNSRQFC